MPRLRGAVVLITGASSGIGAATAQEFARAGSRLVLGARRLDRLRAVADHCRALGSPEVVVRRTDLARASEARGLAADALDTFERIDVLVNNAGMGWIGRLQEMPEESVRSLIDTNVLGLTWVTQAVLPGMLANRRGVIINVASGVALRSVPYSALYSASKAAVMGLSHGLRGELSGSGVKVCVVYPGSTRSEFFNRLDGSGMGPFYSAEWVAKTIVRTARWPRRDAMVLGLRAVQFLEPVLGGFLDHALGERQRVAHGRLAGTGAAADPSRPGGGQEGDNQR